MLLYDLILYDIYIFMKIIKLLAITLLSLCLTVGINILSPTLAQSSAANLVQKGTQLLQQGKAEAALEIWQEAEELSIAKIKIKLVLSALKLIKLRL